jgi:hypothetical protein
MKGKTIKAEMKNSYGSNIQSVKNFAEILLCNKNYPYHTHSIISQYLYEIIIC